MDPAYSGEAPWRRTRIVVGVAAPAAGADWSMPVPPGHLYQLLAVSARLVTSAAVANRAAALALGDGNVAYATIPAAAVQAASLTFDYTWAGEAGAVALGTRQLGPLPRLSLPGAWTLASSTLLIDAADQWSQIRVAVIDTTVRDGQIDLEAIPDYTVGLAELAAGNLV